jgi:hypothetical protein
VLGSEMKHPSNKNNNFILRVTTTTILLSLATIIIIIVAGPAIIIGIIQSAEAVVSQTGLEGTLAGVTLDRSRAPIAVSGDNIYVAWWTNKTANNNEEVMFRASNDAGATFGDKINLSNTTDADSTRAEIAAEGADVVVTWWETNQTSDTPIARISNDGGQTFGPVLMLATNGTIASTEEGE